MRALVRGLSGVLLLATMLLAATQPALAHAQLLSSNPPANSTLVMAPGQAELTFNEPVSALAMTLVRPDGGKLDLLAETADGQTLRVPLPADLGRGTHVLSWRVVSVDAHPIGGSLVFSIGMPSGAAVATDAGHQRATTVLLWAVKAVMLAALLFGVGGAAFALVAPIPPSARQLAVALSALGLVVVPLSLGLQGLDALGLGPEAIASVAPWRAGLSTSYGSTALAAMLALALALVSLLWSPARLVAGIAWPVLAIALAQSGHAGAAEPQWLTRPAVALHVGGILFWTGALFPLLLLLRDRDARADGALARFSRCIPFAVASILVSGLVLAVIQLGPLGPSWLAPYGLILAAKLALLAALFMLALLNRVLWTQRALAGQSLARDRLRQSIAGEIAIMLLLLALVAGWRFTPPPRALTEAAAATALQRVPLYAHAMDDASMVDLTIRPGHAGPVMLELFVTDIAGAAVEPLAVSVTLSSPALGIEAIEAEAHAVDGVWRIDALMIPLPGPWQIDVALRLARFSQTRLRTEIDIPSP